MEHDSLAIDRLHVIDLNKGIRKYRSFFIYLFMCSPMDYDRSTDLWNII